MGGSSWPFAYLLLPPIFLELFGNFLLGRLSFRLDLYGIMPYTGIRE